MRADAAELSVKDANATCKAAGSWYRNVVLISRREKDY